MAEPRSTAEEAGDPSTSPERLLELTEKHPQLHRLIVLNPSCPEVARQWILATDPWAKQAYEAEGAAEPSETDEPEDSEEASVWGDLGTAAAAPPAPAPAQSGAPGVRLSENSRVVPLGATPATASSPASAAPAYGYGGDEPAPAYGMPPAGVVAAGATTTDAEGDQDDGTRSRRRAWYACGGCLLLALVLLLVTALVGRAWLAGDEEEYQRDSSTTSAEETPSEESEETTEEPTEEETQDPVSPAPEDAREMSALRSPTGNISCQLEEDTVSCSVLEHDYSGSGVEGCEAGPFSIQVGDGDATRECGSSFLTEDADTLEYDDSATYGNMACTSRFDGMTCWNTLTGKGFMVNRATYETF